MDEFKLINEKNMVGVWVREIDLLTLIKVTHKRNDTYHKKLIKWYEDLTNTKFKYSMININKYE